MTPPSYLGIVPIFNLEQIPKKSRDFSRFAAVAHLRCGCVPYPHKSLRRDYRTTKLRAVDISYLNDMCDECAPFSNPRSRHKSSRPKVHSPKDYVKNTESQGALHPHSTEELFWSV
jgi:hypothetical protein